MNKSVYIRIGGMIVVLAIAGSIFISGKPHNSPNKAGETKKPTVISSQTHCALKSARNSAGAVLKLPIVLYHYVENVEDEDDALRVKMNIPPREFEKQLQTITSNTVQTIFVRELPNVVNGTEEFCNPSVALTFDDGYESFFTDVFPLLKKYNVKATVFVIANYIDRKGFLQDWQIRVMLRSGLVEIGSHSLDHADLTELEPHERKNQIMGSKNVLESRFGVEITSFSYPLGKYQDVDKYFTREGGYTSAVTVEKGEMYGSEALYSLPRVRGEEFNLFSIHHPN